MDLEHLVIDQLFQVLWVQILTINKKIKLRENFRPFAPSILEEKVSDWFDKKINSEYMSFVGKIKRKKIYNTSSNTY